MKVLRQNQDQFREPPCFEIKKCTANNETLTLQAKTFTKSFVAHLTSDNIYNPPGLREVVVEEKVEQIVSQVVMMGMMMKRIWGLLFILIWNVLLRKSENLPTRQSYHSVS